MVGMVKEQVVEAPVQAGEKTRGRNPHGENRTFYDYVIFHFIHSFSFTASNEISNRFVAMSFGSGGEAPHPTNLQTEGGCGDDP